MKFYSEGVLYGLVRGASETDGPAMNLFLITYSEYCSCSLTKCYARRSPHHHCTLDDYCWRSSRWFIVHQTGTATAFSITRMGNIQCGTSTVFDRDFSLEVERSTAERAAGFCGPSRVPTEESEGAFLRIHQPDRPQRCILEPKEVTKALVEQAEELLLREWETRDMANQGDAYHDEVMSQVTDSTTFLEVTSLGAAPSVVTTFSAATQLAGNGNVDQPQFSKRRLQRQTGPPIIMGGNDFTTSKSVQSEIYNILQNDHENTFMGRSSVKIPDHQCRLLSHFIDDEADEAYAELVHQHTAVLHLKLVPQCANYFQKHLSRLLPDNAITRAVSQGISKSNLSPPRNQRTPELVPSMSSSSSSDVEFGAGPPSTPVYLLATGSAFMDIAVTGSLGLVDRRELRPRVISPERKQLKSPDHYVVLLNRRSGAPLAVCALKAASTGPPVVRIFSTKRRMYGQRPAATTQQLGLDWSDPLPLYTWAEIVTEGRYPGRVRYSIFMATGSDGRFEESPSYCAVHETSGSPEIRVIGRTEREKYHSGCAVLSMCTDEDSTDEEDVFFRISVSRGIDPALLICFCAFIDESLERTMRIQCQNLTENVYRGVRR
jgi:hypothetical protein